MQSVGYKPGHGATRYQIENEAKSGRSLVRLRVPENWDDGWTWRAGISVCVWRLSLMETVIHWSPLMDSMVITGDYRPQGFSSVFSESVSHSSMCTL